MNNPPSSSVGNRHNIYQRLQLNGPVPRRIIWHPMPAAQKSAALVAALPDAHARLIHASARAVFDRFGWLVLATNEARPVRVAAQNLAAHWLKAHGGYHPHSWTPPITAARLFAILQGVDVLLEGQDGPWRSSILDSIAHHVRHLRRAERRFLITSPETLGVVTTRALATLCLPEEDSLGEAKTSKLDKVLERIADGMIHPRWRQKSTLDFEFQRVTALADAFAARRLTPPIALKPALKAMARLLPLVAGEPLAVASSGAYKIASAVLGKYIARAANTSLHVDAGTTDYAYSAGGFTLQDGDDPVIMACGRPSALAATIVPGMAQWREALLTPAAHSTLDSLTKTPAKMRHEEAKEGVLFDLERRGAKDVYHRRRLLLSPDGTSLLGEDLTRGLTEAPLYRFHLAPEIQVNIHADGLHAQLSLPNAEPWTMTTSNAVISTEDSVVATADGVMSPTQQLVITPAQDGVRWALRKKA